MAYYIRYGFNMIFSLRRNCKVLFLNLSIFLSLSLLLLFFIQIFTKFELFNYYSYSIEILEKDI